MRRFNLIDEPWIPVRFPDGRYEELGIQETLLRASKIATIEDPSPLVVAALHRLLLAVLYRALEGPTDIQQAKELFSNGLPGKKISAYLEKWRDRFWLFDENYPFGQNPNTSENKTDFWTKLTPEYNAASNKVLFDHTDTTSLVAKSPADCVRWLVASMSFSVSGGRGYKPAPSSNGMMCIPVGKNLQDTLLYCLVPYQNRDVIKEDLPLWEREPKPLPLDCPVQAVKGYAELYTWQARMVLLENSSCGDVLMIRLMPGGGLDKFSAYIDPMLAYEANRKSGKSVVKFKENRSAWREFDSLLPDKLHLAPKVIENAILLARADQNRSPHSFLILGQSDVPGQDKINYWRMEKFTLPAPVLNDNFVKNEIRQFLEIAEQAAVAMERSLRRVGKWSIAKGDRKLKEDKWKAGKWIPGDASKFIGQSAPDITPTALAGYWSSLELSFHKVLSSFTQDFDPDEVRCRWLEFVRNALASAWEEYRSSISMNDAWALRALVKAEPPVLNKLKGLNMEIRQLQTEEKSA